MAVWNPDVPNPNDNTPRWGRDSQPITKWEGDQSFGKLVEGFGDTLGIGVKGADFVVKDTIEKDVYKKVDQERENVIGALEVSSQAINPARKSLVAGAEAEVPQAIDGRLGYVESIKNGFEAGKVNDTYYKARLYSIAKDLRATYPGYREYIDKKISSITGFDPANSLINDLLSDINQIAGKKKEDHMEKLFWGSINDEDIRGTPGVTELAAKVKSGEKTPEEGMRQIEAWRKPAYDNKVAKRDFEDLTTTDNMAKYKTTKYFETTLSKDVNNLVNYLEQEGQMASIPQIKEYIRKIKTGDPSVKNDPVRTNAYAQIVDQYMSDLSSRWQRQATEQKTRGGQTMVELMGQDEVNKRIQNALAPLKLILADLRADKPTLALATKEHVKALQDQNTMRLINENPSLANRMMDVNTLETLGGNTIPKIFEVHSLNEVLGPMKEYFSRSAEAAAAQGVRPNPYGPVTFKENIEGPARVAKVPMATSADQALKNAAFLVDNEVKDDEKRGFATYFFHPKNIGTISMFNKESGMRIWNSLTSPTVSREVVRVSANNPELAAQHKNWVEQSFGTEIFGKDVKDFASLHLPVGTSLAYRSEDNTFRIIYKGQDITDKPLSLPRAGMETGKTTADGKITVDATTREASTVIRRINTGIQGLGNYYKATGKSGADVDAFILDNMISAGYNPVGGPATSFPEHIIKSLYTSMRGGEIAKKLREGR